jgi:hypothetical protein
VFRDGGDHFAYGKGLAQRTEKGEDVSAQVGDVISAFLDDEGGYA